MVDARRIYLKGIYLNGRNARALGGSGFDVFDGGNDNFALTLLEKPDGVGADLKSLLLEDDSHHRVLSHDKTLLCRYILTISGDALHLPAVGWFSGDRQLRPRHNGT